MQKPLEKKLAAIMFTNIVGYTRMMGKDEKQALKLLRQSRAIHLTKIEKHHDWIIKSRPIFWF